MKYSKATVIVNPASGARGTLRYAARISEELKACAEKVRVVRTIAEGDGASRAKEAVETGSELIVVVGGDGTVNEVVNGLFQAKKTAGGDCVVGILPAGTSSSLARELGIQRGRASVDVILDGAVRAIDVAALRWVTPGGERKQRVAVTVANFGFGGAVARSVGTGVKKLGGFLAFGLVAAVQLVRYRASEMVVEVDGRDIARSRILCAIVANSRWEGGGMRVAPKARLDDGLLDVIVVKDLPVVSRLRYFPKVYRGTHTGLPVVTTASGRCVVVRSKEVLPFEFDGEWSECRECRVEVIPKGLKVLVPETAANRAGDWGC